MAQEQITQVGALTTQTQTALNDNFTELYASTAGGTLTAAHLLVGNASNVATDTAVTGDVGITNGGVTSIAAGITTHALAIGVATGYAIARGITALDGSNPTTVVTGLTTITGIGVVLNRSTALSSATAFVTYNNISGGSFDLYAWVVAGTASTGTENVAWVAIGTI